MNNILTINDIELLNNLKEQIFSDYNTIIDEPNRTELFNNFKSVKQCKNILKNINQRICENFNIPKSLTKIDINFCDLFEKINNSDNGGFSQTEENGIELGNYENETIQINIIVNCDEKNLDNYEISKVNSYKISSYNNNWTLNLLNTLLHECFHNVQEQLEFNESIRKNLKFNNLSKPAKEFRVDTANSLEYNPTNNSQLYFCKIMEISARKFAFEEILNLYNSNEINTNIQIKNQIEEFLKLNITKEITKMLYGKENLLLNAKNKYLLVCKSEEYKNFVTDFYKETALYYKNLNNKCNKIIKSISQKMDISNFRLDPDDLFALYKDYEEYSKLSFEEKKNYIDNIKKVNRYCSNNRCEQFRSVLDIYLNFTKQNEIDIK